MTTRRAILVLLLCNPLTSVLLGAALVLDARQLALREPGSTCGEWFGRVVMGRMWATNCMMPKSESCLITRGESGIRLLPISAWAAARGQGVVARVYYYDPRTTRYGFWALTRECTVYALSFESNHKLTPAELAEARRLFVDNYIALPPDARARLRTEDFVASTTIWSGYADNALALTGLVLLRVSLAWVRRTGAWLGMVMASRRAAARLERGVCPDCMYPIAGLSRCPECGRLLPLAMLQRVEVFEPGR